LRKTRGERFEAGIVCSKRVFWNTPKSEVGQNAHPIAAIPLEDNFLRFQEILHNDEPVFAEVFDPEWGGTLPFSHFVLSCMSDLG
jgi:hypothetical protein